MHINTTPVQVIAMTTRALRKDEWSFADASPEFADVPLGFADVLLESEVVVELEVVPSSGPMAAVSREAAAEIR
jgi:hypothetical protein